jgi:hypothetical protein
MGQAEPTYRESVSVGWALFWRIVGSFMLLIFAMNGALLFLFPELTRAGPPLWVALFPFLIATLFCIFLVMPHVVRRLLRTSFRGSHVQFIRGTSE